MKTKYRINQGITKLTLANSRAPIATLSRCCTDALFGSKVPITDPDGTYSDETAEHWDSLPLETKRQAIINFIGTFDSRCRLVPVPIQWGQSC